ncbi:RHS repeat-associated core domain-containing protein, partial [Providencia stuartii]
MTKGYAGLYWHGPSGLYLGAYRTYDPKARRWLSRDPIEEAGGLNLYA